MQMKTRTITPILTGFLAACALAAATAGLLPAQAAPETPLLKIDAGKPGPAVGLRYGLMTEEINFSYDGGLYAELVRNRSFKEDAKDPVHWSLIQEGDAAWMTNMERNSDLVIMSAYAPLFVNVNPGGMQWPTDLIGYDALNSYGSPAYYAQVMFNNYRGDVVLPVTAQGIPTRTWQPPAAGRRGGQPRPGAPAGTPPTPAPPVTPPPPPPAQEVATVFWSATRDTKTGTVFLKIVNRAATPQALHVEFSGLASVDAKGQAVTLSASAPADTNSITEPTKIVPVTSNVDGLGTSFTRTFPPYSLTVLQLKAK